MALCTDSRGVPRGGSVSRVWKVVLCAPDRVLCVFFSSACPSSKTEEEIDPKDGQNLPIKEGEKKH